MRSLRFAITAALTTLLLTGAAAWAHSGSEETVLQVEPSSVTAGDTVVLAGSGLEPNVERTLVLAGSEMTIQLGTAMTDTQGMLQAQIVIPAHVPSGTYELQAIGDETLSTPLAVTASATGAAASPPPGQAAASVIPRDRSPLELGFLLVLVLASLAVGGLLVWRAEKIGDAVVTDAVD